MSSLQRALLAAPSLPAFFLPRNAHSSQRGAPESSKEFESLPRWRPKAKRRRFAIDRLGDFAPASSSTSSASASSSSSFSSSSASSLAAAASAALARSLYPELINDPFASLLAEAAGLEKKTTDGEEGEEAKGAEPSPSTPPRAAFAAAAAAFADATLLRAADLVNLEADRDGLEYRQVVLLGPGLDSRAQRLAWPAGTVLFECASADAHAVAAAALASERAGELASEAAARAVEEGGGAGGAFSAFNGSKAPRGRLLRRIVCDVSEEGGREALAERLFAAGFRAERLSVWCVNAGAFGDGSLDIESLGQIFGAVASCAAFCSFVVGDLPAMTRAEAEGVVAGSGLLGSVVAFGSGGDGDGSAALWRRKGWSAAAARGGVGRGEPEQPSRWLFVGQQRSRSDAELGILRAFSEAAEDAEGFEDNVS